MAAACPEQRCLVLKPLWRLEIASSRPEPGVCTYATLLPPACTPSPPLPPSPFLPGLCGQLLNSLSVWFCSPCVEKDEQGSISEAWDVDPGLITKLKEQYKKERKGKKGVKSKSCQALSASLLLLSL